MACALDNESIGALYEDIYLDIKSRIDKRKKGVFDMKDYSKNLYNSIVNEEDPVSALQVVQVVPKILNSIINSSEAVQDYFLENDIPTSYIKESKDFRDLNNVAKYVQKTGKRLQVIEQEIERAQKNRNNVILRNPDNNTLKKSSRNTAKVEDPASTSFFYYLSGKPGAKTVRDPQKDYIYTVIRKIKTLTEDLIGDETQVVYDDIPIAIKPTSILNIDENYLVDDDKKFKKEKPALAADLLLSVVTDTDGNLLFFDQDGNVSTEKTMTNGIVYQYIRKVKKVGKEYVITNRSNYQDLLLTPEEIVDREIKREESELEGDFGIQPSIRKQRIEDKKKIQQEQLENIYNMQNVVLNNPDETYLLEINGGSYGVVDTAYIPLSETPIEIEDLSAPIVSGKLSGYMSVNAKYRDEKGTVTEGNLLLQRGDMSQELADKIADIVTTTAKFNGRELTLDERLTYVDIFLKGTSKGNKITISSQNINSVELMYLNIDGEYIAPEDIQTNETKEKISNHLMNAKVLDNGDVYPADVSYNSDVIGSEFIDYNIEGNKITTTSTKYNDFIKPFVKIEFSNKSGGQFVGKNSYLTYSIPKEINDIKERAFDINSVLPEKEEVKPLQITEDITLGVINPVLVKQARASVLQKNINDSDVVLNLSTKKAFKDTKDESGYSIRNAKDKYIPMELANRKTASKAVADAFTKKLNEKNARVINITGNNIYNLRSSNITQATIDGFVKSLLEQIVPNLNTAKEDLVIIATGQSGVSEAAIKAAKDLGVTVIMNIPKNYEIVTARKSKNRIVAGLSNTKAAFLERFEETKRTRKVTSKPVNKKSAKTKGAGSKTKFTGKKRKYTKAKTTSKKKKAKKGLTKKQEAEILQKLNQSNENLKQAKDRSSLFSDLERSKGVSTFFDRLFTSKADKKKALDWYNNESNLKGIIPLEVITEIVNSNAFAKWSKDGITLYEADGGTPVDLYHEAWHGFSQLFLTVPQKESLYASIKNTIPKFKNAEPITIEEALAEDFRSYAKGQKKFKGIVGKIFNLINKFLKWMYGGVTRTDMTSLRDIPRVKELYNQLYKGEILDLKPSTQNIYEDFHVLNSLQNTIKLTKKDQDNFDEFTIDETNIVLNTFDNIVADIIKSSSISNNDLNIFKKVLNTKSEILFDAVYEELSETRDGLFEQVEKLNITEDSSPEDLFEEERLFDKIDLLNKTLNNFGDVTLSLEGKQKTGVVAFYLNSGRFSLVKEIYKDDIADEGQLDIDDTTSVEDMQQYRDDKANLFNPQTLASQDTLSLLSLITQVEKNAKGEYTQIPDYFGYPQVEDIGIIWNRVSKVTEGSFSYADFYKRLIENSTNYPQLQQLADILKPPGEAYKNNSEFNTETNLYQDLSKPRVRFRQLNIIKSVLRRETEFTEEVAEFDIGVADASFSTRGVIADWTNQFATSTKFTNPYVELNGLEPVLNVKKIIKDFSNSKTGLFKKNLSLPFLRALGIALDPTSAEIQAEAANVNSFYSGYRIDLIFDSIKLVNKALNSDSVADISSAEKFIKSPIEYLRKGLPKNIRLSPEQNNNVKNRINQLAELQVKYSDKYSNFSTTLPTDDRVWEQQNASAIVRRVQALNNADNFQQLTTPEADPDGIYKHMYFLAENNNTFSKYSRILNSLFVLDNEANYGERRTMLVDGKQAPVTLDTYNIGGTKYIDTDNFSNNQGAKTSRIEVTGKFLQELNSMLLNGVEEFMRHASKNTAMGIGVSKIFGNNTTKHLYIDVKDFGPIKGNAGKLKGVDIVNGYLKAELERMFKYTKFKDTKFKDFSGYNRKVLKKDGSGKFIEAGSAFTIFDDILTEEVQKDLYDMVDKAIANKTVMESIPEELQERVNKDMLEYFDKVVDNNVKLFNKAGYVSEQLIDIVQTPGMAPSIITRSLMSAYTFNSFIHKVETTILGYGDAVQYDHSKEEFHKRNSWLATGARNLRSDIDAQNFINTIYKFRHAAKHGYSVNPYNGTFNAGIIKEKVIEKSEYYEEYLDAVANAINKRIKNKKKSKELAEKVLSEYLGIKEGDGQGYIPIEYYRMMQDLAGLWSPEQEALYNDIVSGVEINPEEVTQMFPPLKYQYSGNLKTEGLPLTAQHKFSLTPIVPELLPEGSNLLKLHDSMVKQNIAYSTFESGSKIAHLGTPTNLLNEDGSYNEEAQFTPNVIYADYLKSQVNVNKEFKGNVVFSTQMRKLVLEGLFNKGKLKPGAKSIHDSYIKNIRDYTELVEFEFLEEIGFEKRGDKYFMKDKSSIRNLVNLVRNSLLNQDVLGDHLINIIDITANNNLSLDLSLHPQADRIEKLILSLINKRIIKQKFNGEPLVQMAPTFAEGMFSEPESKLKKGTAEYIKKLKGSNFLPTYHETVRANKKVTAATKVVLTMQGDFFNLLNIEYEGEVIGTVEKLNELLKEDDFVDKYRDQISIVGVRIPVQGLNSMEFAEVFHFLPPGNSNVIISASELVAKSGGDFDVDKLTTYFPNINEEGALVGKAFNSLAELKKDFAERADGSIKYDLMKQQKAAIQNSIIKDLRNILELPQNFASLITPNATSLLLPIAEELAEYVMEYNPKQSLMTQANVKEDGKEIISPTRIFEAEYNLYKHESNNIGKRTLGLGAVENTFNTLMTGLGAYMPAQFMQGQGRSLEKRNSNLFLNHNVTKDKAGNEVISVSNEYDVNNENRVGEVISQMMNGWVDVEKDAWIFYIQGNYEVAPQLLYLLKAGVPVREAIFFVSNPLVRTYVKEQQLANSPYNEMLGTKPAEPQFAKFKAATETLATVAKFAGNPYDAKKGIGSNRARYQKGLSLADRHLRNGVFPLSKMEALVKTDVNELTDSQKDFATAMFLHYLAIEQQISDLTKLKITMNPDTNSRTGGAIIEQSELNIEELKGSSKLMPGIIEKFENDSVIGSYFKNDLSAKILEAIFPLRFNENFVSLMMLNNEELKKLSRIKYGTVDIQKISSFFRDEFVNYIFQNVLRTPVIKDNYKSYVLKTNTKVSKTIKLNFGAFVKDGVLYTNEKALEKEFKDELWVKGNTEQGNYESRGLYALNPATFKSSKGTNFTQYKHFVLERETLRSITSMEDLESTTLFKKELKSISELDPTKGNPKKYVYEKILANKALSNIFNPYHLFNDPVNAYSVEYSQLMDKFGDKLSKYTVLEKLKPETNKKINSYNLYLAEKDFDNNLSTLYNKNLKDLANPQILKVPNYEDNLYISEFFSRLPLVGFLQSGVSAGKYNFTNILEPSDYLFIVKDSANRINDLLTGKVQSDMVDIFNGFMKSFVNVNDIKPGASKRTKPIFKDYLVEYDIFKPDVTVEETSEDLIEGAVPGVVLYDDSKDGTKYYENLVNNNPNTFFVYSYFLTNVKTTNPVPYRKSGLISKLSEDLSMGIPVGVNGYTDNFSTFNPERYDQVKEVWSKKFNTLSKLIKGGVTIALPKSGFGSTTMPSELYIDLSKQMLKFGVLNPDSAQYKDVEETIGDVQGISDAEIITELGLEEDPFVCKF